MKKEPLLTAEEKERYCALMAEHLPDIRKRLGMTQEELESTSGVSRVTLSQIESSRGRMNWLHFTALMQVCCENRDTKELLFARGMLDQKLLSFYQGVPAAETQVNLTVSEDFLLSYCRPKGNQPSK